MERKLHLQITCHLFIKEKLVRGFVIFIARIGVILQLVKTIIRYIRCVFVFNL